MKEHKRIANNFNWVNQYYASVKPELRNPILWISNMDKTEGHGREMFFVNTSGETLDYVMAGGGGFTTSDDGAVPVNSSGYKYENVKHNEAVKIEEYDEYYDLDYVMQIVLEVKSPNLGKLKILSPSEKGGIHSVILLWDNGDAGRYVSITELENDQNRACKIYEYTNKG